MSDLLKKRYRNKKMLDFQGLELLRLRVPSKEDMYKKEIKCSDIDCEMTEERLDRILRRYR